MKIVIDIEENAKFETIDSTTVHKTVPNVITTFKGKIIRL